MLASVNHRYQPFLSSNVSLAKHGPHLRALKPVLLPAMPRFRQCEHMSSSTFHVRVTAQKEQGPVESVESVDDSSQESPLTADDLTIISLLKKELKEELTSKELEILIEKLFNQSKVLVNKVNDAAPGLMIGLPLISMAALFTLLRYGQNIIGHQDAYLQMIIGYFTYGFDRFLDAMEADPATESSDRKRALYTRIHENKPQIIGTLAASFALALRELAASPQTVPFIPMLLSTAGYKLLKRNAGPIKPFYVAAMWTLCTVALPSVMHDKDFSVFSAPQDLLPMGLLMFGATNVADTLDIAEDARNRIKTLPVQLGKWCSYGLSGVAIIASIAMIAHRVSELLDR